MVCLLSSELPQIAGKWSAHHWAHLDVKPSNFGYSAVDDQWYLIDIESAVPLKPAGMTTQLDGPVCHTAKYAAPEVAMPLPHVTRTSDLYSVGVILRDVIAPVRTSDVAVRLCALISYHPNPARARRYFRSLTLLLTLSAAGLQQIPVSALPRGSNWQ